MTHTHKHGVQTSAWALSLALDPDIGPFRRVTQISSALFPVVSRHRSYVLEQINSQASRKSSRLLPLFLYFFFHLKPALPTTLSISPPPPKPGRMPLPFCCFSWYYFSFLGIHPTQEHFLTLTTFTTCLPSHPSPFRAHAIRKGTTQACTSSSAELTGPFHTQ